MSQLQFTNARVVCADQVVHGSLSVRDGLIAALDSGDLTNSQALDLDGDYLLPGLVELHTDNLERHLMPRPKARWPEQPALLAHDAEVAAAGITTVFDALGVGDIDEDSVRGQHWHALLDTLARLKDADLLRVEHRLHVRCEVTAPKLIALFEPFIDHPLIGLISLMDHTPGQRQWMSIEHARTYYTGSKGWSEEKFALVVKHGAAVQQRYAEPHRRYLLDYCRERDIAVASHDDTLAEHVEDAKRDGLTISEFPTRIEAARKARELGLAVVLGAPNVVRGGSHSGNVSAIELARAGLMDAMSSDYVPSSLLLAAFRLTTEGFSVPRAVATVSRNPAHAARLGDRGEIAPGLRADLVQVRMVGDQPVVRAVWRGGARVA